MIDRLMFISKSMIILAILSATLFSCMPDTETPIDETDARTKFVGTWDVSDNALKINYEVTIKLSNSNSSMVLLNNFAGSGDVAVGLVAGKSIAVSYQEIGDAWYVNGTGAYTNSERLDFGYSLEISGTQENRTAIFLK